VAQYTVEKLNQLGAKPITLSDFDGTIVDPDGIGPEKLAWVMQLKNVRRGRIREYAEHFTGVKYLPKQRPWGVPAQLAFPSATQNEIDVEDAQALVKNGCQLVAEGANMPTVPGGVDVFHEAQVLFGPGKAANAGGVATSGLEMAQNAGMMRWTREEVDAKLQQIMHAIHANCVQYGDGGPVTNYVRGANIGGFVKVAEAMLAQGLV
jgi:glutamate dehydrogenase (NADP+)